MTQTINEKALENLGGKFWTRRHEMEEEIESLDYEIIENGHDRIVVIDLMDDDEPEITLDIGHANSTMWVAAAR